MNKTKLANVLDAAKEQLELDYAIIDSDKYGDCQTCVNVMLCALHGKNSKGVFVKKWSKGMNKSNPWEETKSVFLSHDLTKMQGQAFIYLLLGNGYAVKPTIYDPEICIEVSEI